MEEFEKDKDFNNELNSLSDVLSKAGRDFKSSAPDGYFDQFPTLMSERVAQGSQKLSWSSWFKMIFNQRIAIPALASLLLIVVIFNSDYSNKQSEDIFQAEVIQQADPAVLLAFVDEYDIRNEIIRNEMEIDISVLDSDNTLEYFENSDINIENLIYDNL
ncbi:MAG TPA: hypothetical protein PKH65_05700 [Bacteroidia bacterium]|nr:hypothetical protein [Bacteroidia bacterium]HNT80157.1 hypothetical protein [Bacteroidia bacterium]